MPAGGDPIRELGPYLLKGCAFAVAAIAAALAVALVGVGYLIA